MLTTTMIVPADISRRVRGFAVADWSKTETSCWLHNCSTAGMIGLRGALRRALIISTITIPAAQPAFAAPITWWVTGRVSSTEGVWVDRLPPGADASLSITWEPDTISAPALHCPPGSGVYPAILGATVFSGHFGGGAIEVNAPFGNCGHGGNHGVEFHMFHLGDVHDLYLFDQLWAHVHPTDTNAPDLYGILASATHADVYVQGLSGRFQFSGPLSFSRPLQPEPIPEPGSLVLFGTGLLGAAAAWRRRLWPR